MKLGTTPYNGQGLWEVLSAARKPLLDRCERYAQVTIPKVCLPEHFNGLHESAKLDWNSFGAQAVNHLTNKMMMGLFQPNFPFFRLDLDEEVKKKLLAALGDGTPALQELTQAMAAGEQKAMSLMNLLALRPILYEIIRALIVVGNVIVDYRTAVPGVRNLREYVVRRTLSGRLIKILFRDELIWDELDDEVKELVPKKSSSEERVILIEEFIREQDTWTLKQYVNDKLLEGAQFTEQWSNEDFPISVLAWDRASKEDYGTGLVEDYSSDFGTLSVLSEAEVTLAIQLSDYRWVSHPTGMGDIEDFKNSTTGDVLPGGKDDLSMVSSAQTGQSLQAVAASAAAVINRLGRAFLLGSAVTRQAERVTAEEIRMVAQELEMSFGGVYSRLAVDLQGPLVEWLMEKVDLNIKGTAIRATIITGMDALGRGAEAAQLMWFIQDCAQVVNLGPAASVLNLEAVFTTLAVGRGIDPTKYLKSPEQQQAEQQQAVAAENEQVATQAMATEGAKAIASQGQA